MTGFSQSWVTCQYCKRGFKSLGIANHRAACRRKHIAKLKAEKASRTSTGK